MVCDSFIPHELNKVSLCRENDFSNQTIIPSQSSTAQFLLEASIYFL